MFVQVLPVHTKAHCIKTWHPSPAHRNKWVFLNQQSLRFWKVMGNLFLLSALPLYLFFEACQKRPQLNIPSSSLRDDLQKKKKKEKVSKSCCRNWLQRNFQLPLNPAEMEPPAVGDDDSEFILSAVSLTRRLYVKFRCRLKTRNPFACPGNAQCCS